ncbi:phosphate ABC transporter permease subunit PstC [Apibacter adventoris]|uniref:Phosphate transport system permease protein n=1 Tax=Apibacter adventoris TaxID=1679466 RepID=A0A2S8AFT5_9FLAO|nr:phosphate ABC transporter permease subunit PstC [Apibacter adventoris]PQL94902.1 phosphate ABC transporter permease subunit PstC [Apibacter adventoris]
MSRLKWRIFKDKFAEKYMLLITVASILLLFLIGIGLYAKSIPVLDNFPLSELLFSSQWKPLKGQFGFLPFIYGTLSVTMLSVLFALPISLLTSLYITEKSHRTMKKIIFPVLDILAGIPSIIYGVWGVLIIVPWISDYLGPKFSDFTSGYSVLAGGIVLGVMIIPILISLFVEVLSNVSQDLKDASISLGATHWQTSKFVVLRRAFPGILAAIVLSISKAFGETIAVVMVCGNVPAKPTSILDSCYPLPALIANNYGEMLSIPNYESALMFAALILFMIILIFNVGARIILQKVEAKYIL